MLEEKENWHHFFAKYLCLEDLIRMRVVSQEWRKRGDYCVKQSWKERFQRRLSQQAPPKFSLKLFEEKGYYTGSFPLSVLLDISPTDPAWINQDIDIYLPTSEMKNSIVFRPFYVDVAFLKQRRERWHTSRFENWLLALVEKDDGYWWQNIDGVSFGPRIDTAAAWDYYKNRTAEDEERDRVFREYDFATFSVYWSNGLDSRKVLNLIFLPPADLDYKPQCNPQYFARTFDMPCCATAYDGESLFISAPDSTFKRETVMRRSLKLTKTVERLNKYSGRGFKFKTEQGTEIHKEPFWHLESDCHPSNQRVYACSKRIKITDPTPETPSTSEENIH